MIIQQCDSTSVKYFLSYKSVYSMREKTTDWNLTDELLQMNMFMVFLSPLLTRVERNTESFKIMLRYFHFSAIKGDVQT